MFLMNMGSINCLLVVQYMGGIGQLSANQHLLVSFIFVSVLVTASQLAKRKRSVIRKEKHN